MANLPTSSSLFELYVPVSVEINPLSAPRAVSPQALALAPKHSEPGPGASQHGTGVLEEPQTWHRASPGAVSGQ